jgi:DNA-binding beta-propeller fold protein YncE
VRSITGAVVTLLVVLGADCPVAGGALQVETLRSVGGLPAHVAGRFNELSVCRQTRDGTFLVFDRRSQTVFSVAPSADGPREIVQIGAEPGRILQPYAFDVTPDGTFVVADTPSNRSRVQLFLPSGSRLGGFSLPGLGHPIVLDGVVITGLGSLVLTSRSIFLSQPESGTLITELGLDGVSGRGFGELRETGHEEDPALHATLNSGLVVINPEGGFYYVFVAGRPAFRKYDAAGALIMERHIEGVELDEYMRSRPTVWPRRKTGDGQFPVVRPAVRAAAADRNGNLWVSLDVPFTYVYDRRGDKVRVVQLRGAGLLAPTNISFTSTGRLLATPGCFLFDAQGANPRRAPG